MPGGASVNGRFRHLWTEPDQPTSELVDVVAPWVIDASRPFADWYFGEPDVAAEILREWMTRSTSEVFVGRAIVAEDDGSESVGCLLALTGAELAQCRTADFTALCDEIGSTPEADDVVAELLSASHELFPAVADDELYISRVAVRPASRGRGVGRALVVHAIEVARERDLRTCRLDVSADNRAAIRAYEAAGLRITDTSHSEVAGLTYCAMTAPM